MENFKEFFVCPQCQEPVVEKSKLKEYAESGSSFCKYCGKNIAHAMEVAQAMEN